MNINSLVIPKKTEMPEAVLVAELKTSLVREIQRLIRLKVYHYELCQDIIQKLNESKYRDSKQFHALKDREAKIYGVPIEMMIMDVLKKQRSRVLLSAVLCRPELVELCKIYYLAMQYYLLLIELNAFNYS